MQQTEQSPRIGIFGGAFDPPHLSHAAVALAASAQLNLDALRIIPSGNPPHRTVSPTSAEHRLKMGQIAFRKVPQAMLDDRELTSSRMGYTIETLEDIRRQFPGAQLFLVMGEDHWTKFSTWHRHVDISMIATIVVADRIVDSTAEHRNSAKMRREDPLGPAARRPLSPVRLVHAATTHSASAVREALRARDSDTLKQMLDPAVLRYIAAHGLYGYAESTPAFSND